MVKCAEADAHSGPQAGLTETSCVFKGASLRGAHSPDPAPRDPTLTIP